MRRDIEIHINTQDIVFAPEPKLTLNDFNWLDDIPEGQLQEHLYGEITVSGNTPVNQVLSNGMYVQIDYTPSVWPIKIRIKRLYDNGDVSYIYNPTNGSIWFDLMVNLYGTEARSVLGAELLLVNENTYYIVFGYYEDQGVKYYTGMAHVFAPCESDFNICRADHQNSNLLLKCVPTNNYRYPVSGVGLIRWVNGALTQSDMAEIVQEEFSDDGVVIRSAIYEDTTQLLSIDANFDDLD